MQEIFDKFITELNDNTDSLLYKGNYVFKFLQDKLTVYSEVTGTLVNEELDYVPVSILTKQPIPFVDANKRVDSLIEFGLLVRIKGTEYDATTDLDYANIKSVTDALQGLLYTTTNYRYAIKTQEPSYQGWAFLGKTKVAVISCVFNVTQVKLGYFGQDSVFTLGGYTLDVARANINATRRFYTADKKDDLTNDFNKPTGRVMVFELTFNYGLETELLKEVYGTASLDATYTFTHKFNGTTYTYSVVVESANELVTKGGVKQITLRLVEV